MIKKEMNRKAVEAEIKQLADPMDLNTLLCMMSRLGAINVIRTLKDQQHDKKLPDNIAQIKIKAKNKRGYLYSFCLWDAPHNSKDSTITIGSHHGNITLTFSNATPDEIIRTFLDNTTPPSDCMITSISKWEENPKRFFDACAYICKSIQSDETFIYQINTGEPINPQETT